MRVSSSWNQPLNRRRIPRRLIVTFTPRVVFVERGIEIPVEILVRRHQDARAR